MAYPVLKATPQTVTPYSTSSTTRAFTLPTVASGDVIVMIFSGANSGGITSMNITNEAGTFNKPLDGTSGTSRFALFWKFSDGTESGKTITFSADNAATFSQSIISCYLVSGSHYTKPPVFQWVLGATPPHDPPSVTASWGTGENLFAAFLTSATGVAGTFDSYPTGYSGGTNYRNGSLGMAAQATKQSSLATDDPSAFGTTGQNYRTASISAVFGAPPPATINSINGSSPLTYGQTAIPVSLSGYGTIPNSITATYNAGAQSLTCSNIVGDASNVTFSIEDRSEGVDYPTDGSTIRITVSNGTDTSYFDKVITKKVGETVQTFTLPIFDDDKYFAYHFLQDGFTAESSEFIYTTSGFTPSDFVLNSDSGFTSTSSGVVNGWLRPATGLSAGNVYYYQFNINDAGAVTVTSASNTRPISNTLVTRSISNSITTLH